MEREFPREQLMIGGKKSGFRYLGCIRANGRHSECIGVVACGVGSYDSPVDTAIAPFPDFTETVDEEVVTDIPPTRMVT